jgi:predicted permease
VRKLRAFFARLGGVVGSRRRERELAEELESHLRLHIDDNLRAGMSPTEARRQALIRLGGVEAVKESWRDQRGFPALERLGRDFLHAIRMARRNPGFTAVAVTSLALGIGANTAIFSVTDALLLKTLPVEKPEHLVVFAGWDDAIHQWMYFFEYREFDELRRRTRSFAGMAATWAVDRSGVLANGRVDEGPAHIGIVSANYFAVLGVAPAMGRSFGEGEAAAVISYGYWRRRFSLAPDVLGRTVGMNGRVLTIVGVAPRRFTGDMVGQPVDLWIPVTMAPQALARWPSLENSSVRVIGRLKPGVAAKQAEAEARAVYRQIAREIGSAAESPDGLALLPEARGISRPREHFERPLVILTIVAGLVLLIACANVANLLLARSEARRREIAVRLALGAGRARVVRQLLMESVVLALLAGAAGLPLAQWGTSGLARLARAGPWAVDLNLAPDARMLAYTAGLSLLTGLLFGLAPALAASRVALHAVIKGAPDGPVGFRLSKLLVVAQVGLSLVLLIGAGLFVRTLDNLKSQDLGFDREHLLLVRTDAGLSGRKGEALAELYAEAVERVGHLAGVRSASAAGSGVMRPAAFASLTAPGTVTPPAAEWVVGADQIAPRYLPTLGIRLLAGRDVTDRDTAASPGVAIVNEAMARRFYGRTDVVGRRLHWDGDPPGSEMEIVGVVRDAAYGTLRDRGPMMYVPYRQNLQILGSMCLAVRTSGEDPGIAARIRQELRAVAPGLQISGMDWVEDAMDQSLAIERMVAWIAGLFGGLALLLACLGLYGTMSYVAARRTHEIGIRVSLGATPMQAIRMVLGDALTLGLAGIAVGVPVALAGSRLVSGLLFGVGAADAATLAEAAVLLLAVVGAAAWLPAWRAATVDAASALRSE